VSDFFIASSGNKISKSKLNPPLEPLIGLSNPESHHGSGIHFLLILMVSLAAVGCKDACDEVVCFNGGVCVDGDCICAEGWAGPDCSTLVCEPVEFNGHTYEVVAIGAQCWFAENLRSEKYRNGDWIPGNLSDLTWISTTMGARTVFGEGSSHVSSGSGDEVANLANYGRLYNWYSVEDGRGLCPTGWHVPSDGEWKELTDYLGGGSVAGSHMKSSSSDTPPWDGSNSSGFSGLPGGYRSYYGVFDGVGNYGCWWSSSPYSSGAWARLLRSNDAYVYRFYFNQRLGFSVRCVRD